MRKLTILRYLLSVILTFMVLAVASAQTFAPIPPLQSHVTDTVGMLDAKQRNALDQVLIEYESRTGSQVAILLISSTAPEVIEQYSIRVADAWKLGRKGVDDGVILIVAKDNPKDLRRLRIEAGRGVQGTITDAQSKPILQDMIAPHFRQNDYYGGLVAGVSALTSLLDQEHLPASAKKINTQTNSDSPGWPFLLFVFLVLVGLFRSRGSRHNSLNSHGWGSVGAGVILGALASQIGRGSSGGGFGGGSSGGGFSGGGGGFDGGGASGDW